MITHVTIENPASACWDIHIETEHRVYNETTRANGPWVPCQYIVIPPGKSFDSYMHDSLRISRVEEVRHVVAR